MRVLIADDDKNMRFILRKVLTKYEWVERIDEYSNGAEAVASFDQTHYDVVFLDVDMPELDGIETAKLIVDIHPKCVIVFVTAHEEFMEQAFSLYAFDYMLKPFKLERLERTIGKIKEYLEQISPNLSVAESADRTLSAVEQPDKLEPKYNDLLIRVKGELIVVNPADIIMIERENRASVIVTEQGQYPVNKTLNELEQVLPAGEFIRSHKSYILRLDRIQKMTIYGRWTYIVTLRGTKKDALITKENTKLLEERFHSF